MTAVVGIVDLEVRLGRRVKLPRYFLIFNREVVKIAEFKQAAKANSNDSISTAVAGRDGSMKLPACAHLRW